MIGQHRHLCSHLHIIHQQADVSQCMVFPFAGCTYKDDHLLALVQQEMDRFGLIVRLLVVYLMEYFPETVFILRREGVPVTDDGIRDESPADVFIGRSVTAYHIGSHDQHGFGHGVGWIFAVAQYHGIHIDIIYFHSASFVSI